MCREVFEMGKTRGCFYAERKDSIRKERLETQERDKVIDGVKSLQDAGRGTGFRAELEELA